MAVPIVAGRGRGGGGGREGGGGGGGGEGEIEGGGGGRGGGGGGGEKGWFRRDLQGIGDSNYLVINSEKGEKKKIKEREGKQERIFRRKKYKGK